MPTDIEERGRCAPGGGVRSILFVDDEQHVLDGLQNALRKHRNKLDMVFARGAPAALDQLAKRRFDVVIADMRMPGMDGVALLQRVKEQCPGVARIVLSGDAERDAVVRALAVSHQYLSKPCDAEMLTQVVERACDLRTLLEDPALQELVGRLDRLPSAPETYWELTRALTGAESSARRIAEIVERDPAMTAKILQIVNSAYFGLARRVTSIAHAVTLLGVDLLKGLAVGAQVFGAMDSAPPIPGFSMQALQSSGIVVARLAKKLVRDEQHADEAFTAGLLLEVGKIILASSLPDRFREVLRLVYQTGRPCHEVEKELLGVSHAELGAYLLGTWGLPTSIVEAIAFHHTPARAMPGISGIALASHVAASLVADASAATAGAGPPAGLDMSVVETLGLTSEVVRWRLLAEESVQAFGSMR